ncbi:MAG TPA: hypothetical protein VGX68_15750 [Thermoanaerobaculia bacterium]|nr:hypothetical protein [Thermoanaerobaculia bacterium]
MRSGYDESMLRDAIRRVLLEISNAAAAVFAASAGVYAGPKPILRLISPLAEGSDRLVARTALEPALGFKLQCPLPFSREEYSKDFVAESSKAEFEDLLGQAEAIFELDGSRASKETKTKAYEAAGRLVLRQSEILIAVWNGEPGEKGGTGQIIADARSGDLPVVWIDSHQPHEVHLSKADDPAAWVDFADLAGRLSHLLPPEDEDELKLIRRFTSERPPSWTVGVALEPGKIGKWNPFLPVISVMGIDQSIERALAGTWAEFAAVTAPAERCFRRQFVKADYLANVYANKYRNSLAVIYLLGALTVLAAFLGFFTHSHEWSWLELSLFTVVVSIIFWAQNQVWHGRWIDYRVLAEGLWQARLLAVLARTPSDFNVPVRLQDREPQATWYNWYLRAVVHEAGLPNARIEKSYLESFHALVDESMASQINYHEKTIKGRHHLHQQLHRTTEVLFWLAAFACLMHLVSAFWHDAEAGLGSYYRGLEFFLTFCVLVLPAFGAAISAILQQREFKWTVLRSSALKTQLEILRRQHRSIQNNHSEPLGETAEKFSQHAFGELVDWHSVFLGKELSLP